MRSVWLVVSVMAVANLLALGGVVAWLGLTDRLSADRVETLREVFTETVAAEQARAAAEADEDQERAAQAGLPDGPPMSSAERLALRLETAEIDRQRIERLRREVEDLQRTLARDQRILEEERRTFEDERARFEAMRADLRQLEGQEQFRKSLAVLEGLKPVEARTALTELLRMGQLDEVIAYLDAMQDRSRTRIISEFIKDNESAVAADLLEALRTRGLVARGPEGDR